MGTTTRDNLRARIVLSTDAGTSNPAIARGLGITVDTVRNWRRRFHQNGVEGSVAVAEVKAMACALPAGYKVPLSRQSHYELATEAISRGILDSVSTSTIRQWRTGDAIKPRQYRSWIFPRDPDFQAKAARMLDLYARTWNGEPLGNDE